MNDVLIFFTLSCITLIIFGSFFGFLGYLRYMHYKETLLYAERGLLPMRIDSNGKGALRWGIVITALGLALTLGLYPLGWITGFMDFPMNFGPWMLLGITPLFFGLALILIYIFTRSKEKPATQLLEPEAQGEQSEELTRG